MKTKLLVEQHFHGCYGIDFNKASTDDVLYLSQRILKEGIGFIFPTLVTDSIENIKRQIKIIKQASELQTSDMARICGIHLEGIFINPEKKGIHNPQHFLKPTIENFKLIEDDFIKIITLAPELADFELLKYLNKNCIKVQAGHCIGSNLAYCTGVTHTFNAMSGISHRTKSTSLTALTDDNMYCEIIADGVHVNDDVLKLFFKAKPDDKVILLSDCLPCTHSDVKEFTFADYKIFYDGEKATSSDGTLAGSTKLLPEIIKILGAKKLFKPQYIENSYIYHNLNSYGELEWDDDFNVIKVDPETSSG